MGKRYEHLLNKIYECVISAQKGVHHHKSFRKCILKPQLHTILYPLEWLWQIRQTIKSVVENVEKEEPSHYAGGNIKQHSHFRKQFISFSVNVT